MCSSDLSQTWSYTELKARIANLWPKISDSCRTCVDPDCMGYLWLTDSDADALMRAGHNVVRVNPPHGPRFIDSYIRDSCGNVSVQGLSPCCPFLDSSRRCSIHDIRPLVCHLYPLSLETLPDGKIEWALHTNCNFVRSVSKEGKLDLLLENIRKFLESIPENLYREILNVHQKASEVSHKISIEDSRNLILLAGLRQSQPAAHSQEAEEL